MWANTTTASTATTSTFGYLNVSSFRTWEWDVEDRQPKREPQFPTMTLQEKTHVLARGVPDEFSDSPCLRTVKAYKLPDLPNKFLLPDNSVLKIDLQGNYTIEDSDAKVVYRANRIREFNPYMNASDLLEDFIRFVGQLGVKQSEALNVPINAFIHWLIFKAAERDGDDVSDLPSVESVLPAGLLPSPR